MPAKGLIRTEASNQPKEKCAPMKRAIPSQSASEESEQVSKTERVSFGYQPSIRRCQHPVAPEPAS